MAKKVTPVNKLPIPNELHVKTCKVCKGEPKKREFDNGYHKGICCDECLHIISWEKIKQIKK